jgi:hypothetical protein
LGGELSLTLGMASVDPDPTSDETQHDENDEQFHELQCASGLVAI